MIINQNEVEEKFINEENRIRSIAGKVNNGFIIFVKRTKISGLKY